MSKILRLSILIVGLALGCGHVCAEETPNFYDMIADKVKGSNFSGSFGGGTSALNNLPPQQKSCMFMCGMALAGPGATAARKEEMQTCFSSCYSKQLDDGDPDKDKYEKLALEYYAKSKDLGSTLPPPTFSK